jgi:hypothetical protein
MIWEGKKSLKSHAYTFLLYCMVGESILLLHGIVTSKDGSTPWEPKFNTIKVHTVLEIRLDLCS